MGVPERAEEAVSKKEDGEGERESRGRSHSFFLRGKKIKELFLAGAKQATTSYRVFFDSPTLFLFTASKGAPGIATAMKPAAAGTLARPVAAGKRCCSSVASSTRSSPVTSSSSSSPPTPKPSLAHPLPRRFASPGQRRPGSAVSPLAALLQAQVRSCLFVFSRCRAGQGGDRDGKRRTNCMRRRRFFFFRWPLFFFFLPQLFTRMLTSFSCSAVLSLSLQSIPPPPDRRRDRQAQCSEHRRGARGRER